MKKFNRLVEEAYIEMYQPLNEGKILNWIKNLFKSDKHISYEKLSNDEKCALVFYANIAYLQDEFKILTDLEYDLVDIDPNTGQALDDDNSSFSLDAIQIDSINSLIKKPIKALRYLGDSSDCVCYVIGEDEKYKKHSYILLNKFGYQPIITFSSKNSKIEMLQRGKGWQQLATLFDIDEHMPNIIEKLLADYNIKI